MPRKKKVLERHIEKPTVAYAKKKYNVDGVKMNILGRASMPDRLFLFPDRPRWIEFKRPGEEPTPLQADKIAQLRELGYEVEVHDNKEQACAAIDRWWQASSGSEGQSQPVLSPPQETTSLLVRANARRKISVPKKSSNHR